MKKLVSLCISILVAMIAIETIARVGFDPPEFFANMRSDPECGFRMPPNLRVPRSDGRGTYEYWTNSLGFRSPEFPWEPRLADDGHLRLLFVGGSVLNAVAVRGRELMMNRARVMIGKQTGRPTRWFSLGGAGLSPSQQLILLRRHGKTVSPDAVILALHAEHDVATSTPLLHGSVGDDLRPYIVSDDAGVRRTTHRHPLRAALRRYSRGFALLEQRLVTSGFWSIAPSRSSTRQFDVFDPTAAEDAPWRDAWSAVTDLLAEFKREAASLHARFLVLVVPSRRQVEFGPASLVEDTRARAVAKKGPDELRDLNLPERKIGQFCIANGIDCRLLAGPLRHETAIERPPLYLRDGLLSGEGHRVAARAVAAWWSDEPDALGCDVRSVVEGGPALALPPIDTHPNEVRLRPGNDYYLGPGWGGIVRNWQGLGPGAMPRGEVGTIAVPARPGDLVVRGAIPPSAELPFAVEVEIPSVGRSRVVRTEYGSFTVRIASPLPDHLRPPAYYGWVAVCVSCDRLIPFRTHRVGPMIHSAGFEMRRVAPRGRATGCDGVIWAASRLRPARGFEIQGSGAPSNTQGLVVVAHAPILPVRGGRPTIYVNTAKTIAAVPVTTDQAGRFHATVAAPATLRTPVAVQGLFVDANADLGFATTHALVAWPFLGEEDE